MQDPACEVAHGQATVERPQRRLVVVYASDLASHLARWAPEVGFTTTLLEPDVARHDAFRDPGAVVTADPAQAGVDATTDVVVTDHHRDDLGEVMAPLVTAEPRSIGIIGSARHEGPHRAALAARGVPQSAVDRVRRPIGLDIGSRTPAEIALAILAGLIAEHNGRGV